MTRLNLGESAKFWYGPCTGCGKQMRREKKAQGEARCRACRRAEPVTSWESRLKLYGLTPERWLALEREWRYREESRLWLRRSIRTVVLSDLDSTIAHTRHRWHLAPSADPASDWDKYAAACMGDSPVMGVVTALRLHSQHHLVHIVSGRTATAQVLTERWLDVYRVPYDALVLRAVGDYRSNADIKVAYIEELRAKGLDPVLFHEDHPGVVREIQERTDIPVVCVNPRYPEDAVKLQQVPVDGMGGGL